MRHSNNFKFYRLITAVFTGLFLLVFGFWHLTAQSAPLLANYYLPWQIPASEVANLAKYDLLVLDMETQVTSRAQIEKIKSLNPDIILLAYVTSEEISASAATSGSSLRRKLRAGIAPEWFLKKSDGSSLSFWPGTVMLNPSDSCPIVNGWKWNSYLANFMTREVLATGLWSGVFYDNSFDSITWFSGSGIDLNLDKINDIDPNNSWRVGMRQLFASTYATGKNYLVVGNAFVDTYRHDNNGVMIENFQNLPWQDVLRVYRSQLSGQPQPRVVILNGNTGNTGARADYRNVRYGLTTALIGGDGYFAFDYGDKDHGQTWWYDEYDVNLGAPLGKEVQNGGTYRRDFESGVALINPTEQTQTIDLGGEYEKIIGTQDKAVNSGGIVSKLNLPSKDGIILRKTFQDVSNVFFLNGGLARFFTPEGKRARNGFFAFTLGFAGGDMIYKGDLDGQTGYEKIAGENQIFYVLDSTGKIWQDSWPFFNSGNPAATPANLNLSVGELEKGKGKKIVLSGSSGGAVLITTYYGAPIYEKKYPLGGKYNKGFSTAVGDTDGGDGEIILGTGAGVAGEVLIMDASASKIKKRFYPYGSGFKGGVFVGAGDINGDGRAEVLTVAKVNDKILVKTFSGVGKQLKEFSAGTALGSNRFSVGVTDVDGDGKVEIVVGSN